MKPWLTINDAHFNLSGSHENHFRNLDEPYVRFDVRSMTIHNNC